MKKNKNMLLNQNLKKDFIWNTMGTSIYAFNSLFFMIIVTRINGMNDAGVFTLAFSMATLFNIIGVYSGRVFQVTDDNEMSDADYFYQKIITCIIMIVVSLIFIIINNYNLWKSSIIIILCLLKTFEAFFEVIYAFFQKQNKLYKVGISLTLKNLIGLFVFLLLDLITKNLLVSILFLSISYVLIFIFYDIKNINIKKIISEKLNKNNIIIIFKKGFFVFCLSFLSLLIINIPRYIIDFNFTENYNTIFGILIMPSTMILLVSQFIFHPLLLVIKKNFNKNIKLFVKTIIRMLLSVLLLGLIIIFASYLFGIPLLELIYGVNLSNYKYSLLIIMIGGVMNGITLMISNILVLMRVIFKQIIIYVFCVILTIFISCLLVYNYGIKGACVSYCISMISLVILFIGLLVLSVKKTKLIKQS